MPSGSCSDLGFTDGLVVVGFRVYRKEKGRL
jgi:hypothetical protein